MGTPCLRWAGTGGLKTTLAVALEYILELENMGHVLDLSQSEGSTVNGIKKEAGRLYASYDARGGGGVDGE
ncbi:hypothetical protein MTO96_005919 [Rhipicephalus appendiculatus]